MAPSASKAKKSKRTGDSESPGSKNSDNTANRPWAKSIFWSAVTMAVVLFAAVAVNVLIGRVIHWEIVTGLGILGFLFLSVGRRYRTI